MAVVELERDLDAVLAAEHGNPFAFFGMHGTADGLVVRTFQPQARAVDVVHRDGGEVVASLANVDDTGLFAGAVPGTRPFPYRLRVADGSATVEIDDPYAFPPVLGDLDVHLLAEGTHREAWTRLGAHCTTLGRTGGVSFAVWAPNARSVSVVGDFNDWDGRRHPMRKRHECGVWELFVPGLGPGVRYKYEIKSSSGVLLPLKADPYAAQAERPPATASVVAPPSAYRWGDEAWMEARGRANAATAPMTTYEVHLGSWRRKPEEGQRFLTYREMAEILVPYVRDLGFTHVELMPVSEFPFDGSWGYQPIGLFAPTSRFGTPDEFRALVDAFHRAGIGVIVDWVPGHFPTDAHGLALFDGTHLYEHADPRQGFHQDWNTLIYNYGRREVASFLINSALCWLKDFHIDGLRVDAVASMLYLDYSRKEGEWIPNRYGGRENLDAIEFLRRLNEVVEVEAPGAVTVAEESTAWPGVSRPVHQGGLGFGYKWNMGWMHDTLDYVARDPVYRPHHHGQLSFGLLYAFSENFVLPLSHDEVVHGKGSLIGKMPGDSWQKFANLRAYYTFMFGHPGKKLLFMGAEIAQWAEWNHDRSLDWHLLGEPPHQGVQRLVRDLNRLYRERPALNEGDHHEKGFLWIEANDWQQSVVSFLRRARNPEDFVVVAVNFTPVVRHDYRLGVPAAPGYREIMNSDSELYGGSNVGNAGYVPAEDVPAHGFPSSIRLTLPPLAGLILSPAQPG
ncbi:MAG: 1,4-alpha-glucan branching protein GlgB [Xanthobacteraceae bacterium]|nr:1,4-alpha-glucan branching protein GlgB [Xanthobacteraceae bacterium]